MNKKLVINASPVIERLVAVGLYINSAILARILVGVGETDEKMKKNFEGDKE